MVSDNVRKGAATNAVQIAEVLHERGLIRSAAARVAWDASPRRPPYARAPTFLRKSPIPRNSGLFAPFCTVTRVRGFDMI